MPSSPRCAPEMTLLVNGMPAISQERRGKRSCSLPEEAAQRFSTVSIIIPIPYADAGGSREAVPAACLKEACPIWT